MSEKEHSQLLKADIGEMPILEKLTRDLKRTAGALSREEARGLVDLYYQLQHGRIQAGGQLRALNQETDEVIEGAAPPMISFFLKQFQTLERQMQTALDAFSESRLPGRWMKSLMGIGPVISAGCLAHIDITRAPHAGNVLRFAGLTNDPWLGAEKAKELVGELEAMADNRSDIEELMRLAEAKLRRQPGSLLKMMFAIFGDENEDLESFEPTRALLCKTLALRPWNAGLKCLLVFKLGESFVKTQNNEKDIYGHIFAERKARYKILNSEGAFKADAEKILREKNIGKQTDAYAAYSQGQLPPAHIHARARRYAVKRFVCDLHSVLHFCEYKTLPPLPYIIDIGGHADYEPPPNMHVIPGMVEAFKNDDRRKVFLKES